MKTKWMGRCVAIILIIFGIPALATIVTDLATATVPVADRTSEALNQALPKAIGESLIKMSGNTAVMTLPAIQNEITSPLRFVTSYSYKQNTAAEAKTPWLLQVRFDATALRHLLQQSDQAIWGADRPQTLFWLSVPQEDQTGVLASGDQNSLLLQIQKAASDRGLPYLLPTMDLQDQASVPADVSQLPDEKILQAEASRYGVESVLAVAIHSNDEGGLVANWKLILDGAPYQWQKEGDDVGTLLREGINDAANMMANRFATLTNKALESNVLLQVSGVEGLQDYSQVLSRLRHLMPVSAVNVVDLSQERLLLNVNVSGGSEALAQALKMSSSFQPETNTVMSASPSADLYYHYELRQ